MAGFGAIHYGLPKIRFWFVAITYF